MKCQGNVNEKIECSNESTETFEDTDGNEYSLCKPCLWKLFPKRIYRDWDHWWANGRHGFTSASRELVRRIWQDLEPTIQASRDDYKKAYVALMVEETDKRQEIVDLLFQYIDLHTKEGAPTFGRWWCDQITAGFDGEDE